MPNIMTSAVMTSAITMSANPTTAIITTSAVTASLAVYCSSFFFLVCNQIEAIVIRLKVVIHMIIGQLLS